MISRCILCLGLSICTYGVAETNIPKKSMLEEIHKIQNKLDKQELEQDKEQSLLRELEVERNQMEKDNNELQVSLQLSKSNFAELGKSSLQLTNSLKDQIELLQKLAVVRYIQQNESPLKVMLYVADKDQWYKNISYHRYITHYQLSQLLHTNAALHSHNNLLEELTQTQNIIRKKQTLLNIRLAKLENIRSKRQQALIALRTSIGNGKKKIKHMESVIQRLDNLAVDIGKLKPDELVINGSSFRSLRGKLPLPTQGTLVSEFTDSPSKEQRLSNLHSKGMLFATSYGNPVIAVASGNVAFADWIRGFGLVIIIDHGDDYISLYAHNQELAKKRGDWVNSGDIISYVGETGGQDKPLLYFELRHKSISFNPKPWLGS